MFTILGESFADLCNPQEQKNHPTAWSSAIKAALYPPSGDTLIVADHNVCFIAHLYDFPIVLPD
ncbi:hypothetical protein SD51_07710 [Alicyclobacillus tengchongensis]|nr:hypothetical protein SD51_07710 [Alicyclobacillus tengchongensis]